MMRLTPHRVFSGHKIKIKSGRCVPADGIRVGALSAHHDNGREKPSEAGGRQAIMPESQSRRNINHFAKLEKLALSFLVMALTVSLCLPVSSCPPLRYHLNLMYLHGVVIKDILQCNAEEFLRLIKRLKLCSSGE